MSIIDQLATSLNRRDEVANQELAKKIVQSGDMKSIEELVVNLKSRDQNIQADCIKVLYEIGAVQPALIREYIDDFAALLNSKNNRLAWGGMVALNYLANEDPGTIYTLLPKLVNAANSGSVITRDNLVSILIKIGAHKKYTGKAFKLLIQQITTCPTNQLPMYAENAVPVIASSNKSVFIKLLLQRLPEIESDSKKKRIYKVIKKMENP